MFVRIITMFLYFRALTSDKNVSLNLTGLNRKVVNNILLYCYTWMRADPASQCGNHEQCWQHNLIVQSCFHQQQVLSVLSYHPFLPICCSFSDGVKAVLGVAPLPSLPAWLNLSDCAASSWFMRSAVLSRLVWRFLCNWKWICLYQKMLHLAG